MSLFQKQKTRRLKLMFLIPVLIGADLAIAQGPPIHTETALITGFTGALRVFDQEVSRSGNLSGGMTGDLHVRAIPFMFPYTITEGKLLVGVAVSYLNKDLRIEGPSGTTRFHEDGIGDLTILGEYAFFIHDEKEKTTRASVIGGTDLPTGTSGRPDIPPGLWNGSGSVDPFLGVVFSYIPARWGLYTDIIYRLTTRAKDFRFGDTIRYDVALGYRLWPAVYETYPSPQLNLFLEFNGLREERSMDFRSNPLGERDGDSGGNRIFISPGIQYIPGRAFLVEASLQLPLLENLNGAQLKTDYQFSLGLRWLIF